MLEGQGVARLRITPAVRTVAVGDSLRLVVEPLDQNGNVVAGATIRFSAQGGRFQGSVDSLGWVRAGSPGTVPVSVSATVPGGRPVAERIDVRILPGPAVRIALVPNVSKVLVGQRVRLQATVLTATGDARDDAVAWTSSNASVLRVADGLIAAVAPGNATVTARAGAAQATVSVQVVPSSGVTVEISPARTQGRQGDVIRFALAIKDARGAAIADLTPSWSMSPGDGSIDEEGAFVGNAPGRYQVTASLGTLSADAVVTLS
ncbi:MAG: Ig-like domain-containing protein, partial [Gemmatimonadaceae bacterium]